MAEVNLNTEELKDYVNYMVTNNRYLQSINKMPIAMNIEGESGIGKTSTILQIAEEMKFKVIKLNLAQLEELGDLVGFPCKEFEVVKKLPDGKTEKKWIPETVITTYIEHEYKPTGEKRMTHAAPEWVQGLSEGGILLLDDYSRADIRFLQATMDLIDRQEYISWKLPKDWHIILSSNPDSGDYFVTTMDPAQKTRFIKANLKFNVDCWANWAEKDGIDGRCINFLLLHPELVSQSTNARSITTFFNAISSIKDFEAQLPLIQMIGEGSVGTEFSTLFSIFINNRLDKLISPEDIVNNPNEEHVLRKIRESVSSGDIYRADIASTLVTRVVNYTLNFAEKNPIPQNILDRLTKLASDELTFTNDLKYIIVKKLVNGNKQKFSKMLTNKALIDMAIK